MAKRECIHVAGISFSGKTALRAHASSVLARWKMGIAIEGADLEFLLGLLDRHPHAEQKIGPGVERIWVGIPPGWPMQRGFWLRRIDGSETDWSFLECVKASSQRAKFLSACRRVIASQVIAFKFDQSMVNNDWMTCQITGELITVKASHVDHEAPNTFLALVNRFIEEFNIDVETVQIGGNEDGRCADWFIDQSLSDQWAEFHRKHAKLRLVSAKANLGILKRKGNP